MVGLEVVQALLVCHIKANMSTMKVHFENRRCTGEEDSAAIIVALSVQVLKWQYDGFPTLVTMQLVLQIADACSQNVFFLEETQMRNALIRWNNTESG